MSPSRPGYDLAQMGTAGVEPHAVQRPPRVSSIAGAVVVGLLIAAIWLWLLWLLASLAGVIGWVPTAHASPGASDWPFVHAGPWSFVANVLVGLAVTVFCAVFVRGRVRYKVGEPVSLPRTIAILVITGYVPYLSVGRLTGPHFVLGLLATAFLLREYAIGVTDRLPVRHGRLLIAAVSVAALFVPVAYGATHPLWYGNYRSSTGTTAQTDWTHHRLVLRPKRDKTIQLSFTLTNSGFTRVKLLAISGAVTPMIQVTRAVAGYRNPWSRLPAKPLRGTTIGARHEQSVTLFIHLRGCNGASGTFTLDRIKIRYRTGGLTLAQPVALAIRPTVSCPSH